MAMVAAGFSGGEAEELRRAMGFKRSVERMDKIEARLRSGMTERGILGEEQDADRQADHLVRALRLPRVARGELRAHRLRQRLSQGATIPPRSTPRSSMPGRWASTIRRRWSRTPSAAASRSYRSTSIWSGWKCRWDPNDRVRPEIKSPRSNRALSATTIPRANGALRLGLRFVKTLRQEAGEAIEREQAGACSPRPRISPAAPACARTSSPRSLTAARSGARVDPATGSVAGGPSVAEHRSAPTDHGGASADTWSPLPEMSPLDRPWRTSPSPR